MMRNMSVFSDCAEIHPGGSEGLLMNFSHVLMSEWLSVRYKGPTEGFDEAGW